MDAGRQDGTRGVTWGDSPTPWWQATRTLRQGYLMAGLSLLVATLGWVSALGLPGSQPGVQIVIASFWTLFATFHVHSAYRLHRRARATTDELPTGAEAD